MATIRIYDGTNYTDVEVTDEFAESYSEMKHREYLVSRQAHAVNSLLLVFG